MFDNAGTNLRPSNCGQGKVPNLPILLWIHDQRWAWLREILCMNENRLLRKVLLGCVLETVSSIFGDAPELSGEWAISIAIGKEERNMNRPSSRTTSASLENKATTAATRNER